MYANNLPDSPRPGDVDPTIHLRELLIELAVAVGIPQPREETAFSVLEEICQVFSRRHERVEDDFDSAIQRAPWLTSRFLQLRQRHGEILMIIDELQIQIQDDGGFQEGEALCPWIADLRARLGQLLEMVREHATDECALLQDSFDEPEWT